MAAVTLVELRGVSADIDGRSVLADVDFRLGAGELVAICGPNGAGKSSLLRAAVGLLKMSGGQVWLAGQPLRALSDRERASRVAYLPQDRRIAWNLPAIEVARLGAPFLAIEAGQARALAALEEVHAADLADRGVAELSGGERARVLLARALATEASALLADEPVAGLDPDAQLLVLDRLKAGTRAGQGIAVSLHDLTLAARYADRVVVIAGGRIAADGPPLQALTPEILRRVFGLEGRWLDALEGPLLAARRY